MKVSSGSSMCQASVALSLSLSCSRFGHCGRASEISDAKVLMTVLAGREVYRSQNF